MFRRVFLTMCAALLMAGVTPAAAQGRRAPGNDIQRLDRILPQVYSRYPGTFYDAHGPFLDESGNPHYRLKWMTPDGRIIWLDTDARTGRVMGVTNGGWQRGGNFSGPPPDAPPPYAGRGRFGGGGFPPGDYYGDPRGGQRGWNGRGGPGGHNGWNGRGGHDGGHDGGHGHHGG
ncbi:MAG TPA: hypothetical protein VIJ85_03460 [Rhizomicrobium sp.]